MIGLSATRREIAIFLLIPCCCLLFSSCYRTHRATPETIKTVSLDNFSEIKVIRTDNSESVFDKGKVEQGIFHGVTPSKKEVKIPLEEIAQFELKELNTGKSIVVGVAVFLAAAGFILLIAIATASCPHVYAFDGERWVLEAEPNAGAITRAGQYTDYSVLPHLRPDQHGVYTLKLTNELDEIDFIDRLKLLVVDHAPQAQILPDHQGELVAIYNEQKALQARTRGGLDLTRRMNAAGEFFWDGEPWVEQEEASRPREEVVFTYRKPQGAKKAALIFKGSNTLWGNFIMADFLSRFGKSAKERFEALNQDPRAKEKIAEFLQKNGAWVEVQVKRGDSWKQAGHFKSVGMKVPKTQVLSLDVDDVQSELVQVKLKWAPLFWNIMKLNADFSDEQPDLTVRELPPASAVDLEQGNILSLVSEADGRRYRAVRGDAAIVRFGDDKQAPPGMHRTYILKSDAYYELILDESKEAPAMKKMWMLLQQKGIDAYSLDKYYQTLNSVTSPQR